jgi:hypothetical protein
MDNKKSTAGGGRIIENPIFPITASLILALLYHGARKGFGPGRGYLTLEDYVTSRC